MQAEHVEDVQSRDAALQQLKEDAKSVLDQRRVQSDLELLLEARLNDDDLERTKGRLKSELTERDARYMKLFADFQVQKSYLAKTMSELRKSALEKEALTKEMKQLRDHTKLLEVRSWNTGTVKQRVLSRNIGSACYFLLYTNIIIRWKYPKNM